MIYTFIKNILLMTTLKLNLHPIIPIYILFLSGLHKNIYGKGIIFLVTNLNTFFVDSGFGFDYDHYSFSLCSFMRCYVYAVPQYFGS